MWEKPWAGALTAESWPAAPLRGSPSVSSRDWGGRGKSAEGTLTTTTPLPLRLLSAFRLALAFQPAAECFPFTARTRSEGARLQQRLPMSRAAKSPGDRKKRNPAGKPGCFALLPGICCQSRFCKNGQVKNPEVIPSAAHSRKEDLAQPHTGAANPCTIRMEGGAQGARNEQEYSLKKKRSLLGPRGMD